MEKGNRKQNSQKSNKNQLPQPKKRREAKVIITPDAERKVDIQTGNVSDIEMYKYLNDMARHFANVIVEDAEEVVGKSQEEQVAYLNWRIKQSGINE